MAPSHLLSPSSPNLFTKSVLPNTGLLGTSPEPPCNPSAVKHSTILSRIPGYVVISDSHAPAPVSGPPQQPQPVSNFSKEVTWASKVKPSVDKSLERLSPQPLSPSGILRVKIPEAIFQKGAELHQDFIICRFFGRIHHHSLIQSVLNFMWGKGRHLEIHSGLASNSVLVRIQNDFIRNKVLEKRIWYVDTTMFHVAQWSEDLVEKTPSLDCIPLWMIGQSIFLVLALLMSKLRLIPQKLYLICWKWKERMVLSAL